MAPSAILNKSEVSRYTGASAVLDFLPVPARTPERTDTKNRADVPVSVNKLFQRALIEQNRVTVGSRALDVAISVVLHITIIGAPILASLYYTNTINLKQFTATMLVAPPPPPPPPPPAATVIKTVPVRHVFMHEGKLIAPRYVPEKVADIKEAPIPEDSGAGVTGGVPGGVPGGQMGGVIGGIIGGLGKDAAPLVPTSKPRPIRVGGHVRAPRAIFQPAPTYPVIARQARVSGTVVIDAVLDEQGNVIEMKVLSGPPLLYGAALDALKKWKYEPTYLNDSAISVQMIVTVTFQLTG